MSISFNDLEIRVTDPTKNDDHIIYKISIRDESRGLVLHSVYRRFRQFEEVFKALKAKNLQPPLPDLPPKKTFGKFDAKFLETRRKILEQYLGRIKENKYLVRTVEFRCLIGYDEMERRLLEQTRSKKKKKNLPKKIRVDPSAHPGYPVRVPQDEDLTHLQRYLRNAEFSLVKPLPNLSPNPTKSHFLVKGGEETFVMSVGIRRIVGMEIVSEKHRRRFSSFVTSLNDTSSPFIHSAVSADFDLNAGRSFVVRSRVKHGSLRDYISNKAEWSDKAETKAGRKKAPIKDSEIAYFGKQILIAAQTFEESGIPCPQLTIGNILVGSKQLIQISDWEDILLGLTKLPMLHMPGDLSERTSPYLLQAGVVLLEMARGEDVPIRLRRMMMACQGDLFNTEVSIEPEEEESELRFAFPVDFTKMKLPKGLAEVLKTIFDPEQCVAFEDILAMPFFRSVKFKEPIKMAADTIPRVRVKSKDLEAVREAADNWHARLVKEQEGEDDEPSSPKEKKPKKEKRSKKGAASPSGGPPPPPPGGPPGAPPPPGVPGAPPPPGGPPGVPPPPGGAPPPPGGMPPPPPGGMPPPPPGGMPPPPPGGMPPPPPGGMPPPPPGGPPPVPGGGPPPVPGAPGGAPPPPGGPPPVPGGAPPRPPGGAPPPPPGGAPPPPPGGPPPAPGGAPPPPPGGAPPPPPPPPGGKMPAGTPAPQDGRGALLDAIRKGNHLTYKGG